MLSIEEPGNIRSDGAALYGIHHGSHGFIGGQPVGIVIATAHMAHAVQIAEHEWHRAEPSQTRTRLTFNISKFRVQKINISAFSSLIAQGNE